MLAVAAYVVTLHCGGCRKIELLNRGANTAYFRCDGTTPTVAKGDQILIDSTTRNGRVVIEDGKIENIKFICDTGETATVFVRMYS